MTSQCAKPIELFTDGKIDAFLGLRPDPQDLRARPISHVIIVWWVTGNSCNSTPSRPSACSAPSSKQLTSAPPTPRSLRRLVDGRFTPRYDYALQTLSKLLYKWREYDIEDSIRFYALRLHEIGMIKASPQEIIAEGTDWRFFNELERELKA